MLGRPGRRSDARARAESGAATRLQAHHHARRGTGRTRRSDRARLHRRRRAGQRLVGDITYLKTGEGWLYLATVIDLATRMVVGWQLADHMRTSLVVDALAMAIDAGLVEPDAIFHSDSGGQGGFNRSSQHLDRGGGAMGYERAAAGGRAVSGADPVAGAADGAWREDRVRFWAAIARGVKTEDAAVEAGVSGPVGFRWFRHAGGVNPRLAVDVSGRYLSFAEREDIAIWRAQSVGVREIARRLGRDPVDDLAGAAPQRVDPDLRLDYKASIAQWHAERRARRPKVAKLAANDRLREYVQDRLAGRGAHARRASGRSGRAGVEGPEQAAPRRPAVGARRGARSRSRTGSRSTSLMMSPCGSATRRSTRRSTSRAAAR